MINGRNSCLQSSQAPMSHISCTNPCLIVSSIKSQDAPCYASSSAVAKTSEAWQQNMHGRHFPVHSCMTCGLCRHSDDAQLWGSLCNVWDMAFSQVARARGSRQTLDFRVLMQQHVAHQLLKPVRARSAFWLSSIVFLCSGIPAVKDIFEWQSCDFPKVLPQLYPAADLQLVYTAWR